MKRFISLMLGMMCLLMFLPINALAYNSNELTRYTVLVLDVSGKHEFYSGGTLIYTADPAINYVKEAADNFLNSLLTANGKNYVSIVTYSDSSRVLLDFTDDINTVRNAVNSLSSDESINLSNICAGLNEANILIESVNDNAIKNVILVTTGITNTGDYSYSGHYNAATIASNWESIYTHIKLYAYANAAYDKATKIKENADLYVLGIFQTVQNIPEKGKNIAEFFKLFCKDIASSDDINYAVEDPENIDQYFDDVADKITDTVSFDGNSYQLFNEGLTWTEAKQKCEQIGGHLVTITSADEQEFVNSLMRDKGTKNNYWCGAYRSGDSWAWVSGENFGYTNWVPNEPNNWNGKNEQYVHMFGVRYTDGSGIKEIGNWNDAANDGAGYAANFYDLDGFGYICEWDNTDLPNGNTEPNDTASASKTFYLNGHRYEVIQTSEVTSFQKAEEYCRSVGGYLATIQSQEENDFIYSLMTSKGYDSAYFGLTCDNSEKTWKWTNGETVNYLNWADGEPNNQNSHEYYAMFYYKFTDGKWNDGSWGDNTVAFICEWDNDSFVYPNSNTEPIDTTNSSEKLSLNGHTYQRFETGLTWDEAKKKCEDMGGHLATITSTAEQDFITSLISKNGSKNCYWCGGYKENEEWKWVTGEQFNYSNWAQNEPNNWNNNENCIHLFGTRYVDDSGLKEVGSWNDALGTLKMIAADFYKPTNFGYICEWESDYYPADPSNNVNYESSLTVSFDPDSLSISEYGSRQLNLILDSDDPDVLDVYEGLDRFTDGWVLSSSDNSVVTVDANGVINAVKEGKATITALNPDYCDVYGNRIPVTCMINVLNPYSVDWNNDEYVPKGASPAPVNTERVKVSNYVASVSDSASPAPANSSSGSPIAATGSKFEENNDYTIAVVAVAFLAVIALGFIAVAGKKRHYR